MAFMGAFEAISFLIPRMGERRKLKGYVFIPNDNTIKLKEIVCALKFLDKTGSYREVSIDGYDFSQALSSYYVYLDPLRRFRELYEIPLVEFPDFAANLRVDLITWDKASIIDPAQLRFLYLEIVPNYEGDVVKLAKPISSFTSSNFTMKVSDAQKMSDAQ
ncbi:MAG: hypothetical protein M9932_17715 [Xanthobacteraceae bacterium]|nr:hypothetical protein [Xanthobacteraceae bacterium]